MKKGILILIIGYLFFMFLVYSGVFRNAKDPLVVAKYYLECYRNKEGFLTYAISIRENFDPDKRGDIYLKNNLKAVRKIAPSLIQLEKENALVQLQLFYSDATTASVIVHLKKIGERWFIAQLIDPSLTRKNEKN